MSASAPLAYAWVRSHGVMLSEVGGEPVLLGTADTAAWAVAELRRRHGPLPFQMLDAAAWLLPKLWRDAVRLKPRELVAEYARHLEDELDMMREAANCSQLRRNFADSTLLAVRTIVCVRKCRLAGSAK